MKVETATIITVGTAASGFTILGGVVFGLPKAAIVGAAIGTLFIVAALPTNAGWRRWVAVLASFAAGAVASPIFEPMIAQWIGVKVATELIHASGGLAVAAFAQAGLGWAAGKLFGSSS